MVTTTTLKTATLLIGKGELGRHHAARAWIQRVEQLQKDLKAALVIQHDPRDVGKLPAVPTAAR